MMSLALLLFFVVASAQCYDIVLYNNQSTPLYVQYGRNDVHSSVTIPEMANGVPPSWTLAGLTVDEYSSIMINMNLVVSTRPVDPPTTPPQTKVFVGYMVMGGGIDTSIVMRVYTPGWWPIPRVVCNEQPLLVHKCDKMPISNPEELKTMNVPYVDVGQYQVWFS